MQSEIVPTQLPSAQMNLSCGHVAICSVEQLSPLAIQSPLLQRCGVVDGQPLVAGQDAVVVAQDWSQHLIGVSEEQPLVVGKFTIHESLVATHLPFSAHLCCGRPFTIGHAFSPRQLPGRAQRPSKMGNE